jgi:hypothetical protein
MGIVELKIPLLFNSIPEPALASVESISLMTHTTEYAEVVSLDSMADGLDRLDFIKIDVEGHELHCLRGARRILQRYRPLIQFEENDPVERLQLFKDFANELNYQLALLESDGRLKPIDGTTEVCNTRNFYLAPQERSDLFFAPA